MSGSVQKTIPEEKILCIERELPARKNRRRFCCWLRQDVHKLFACNRFMLVQVFSDFMKLGQVVLQKLDRFLVLRFYKVDGQGIDLGLCLG